MPILSFFGNHILKEEDIALLQADLLQIHGYDFRDYSRDSLKRRVNRFFKLEKFETLAQLREKLRSDREFADHFIDRITINVTGMFRDSSFFALLRHEVIPALAPAPVIRVWCAGCSTGEEVYSIAILLHEAGLLHKSELHGTDINSRVIEQARKGIYPVSLMQLYALNYAASGGTGNFSSYYTTTPAGEKFHETFTTRMTFATENLASENFTHKFDLVLCRNVVIYFDRELQDKTFDLFNLSLKPGAYLGLGEKETINFTKINRQFGQLGSEKIWKKIN